MRISYYVRWSFISWRSSTRKSKYSLTWHRCENLQFSSLVLGEGRQNLLVYLLCVKSCTQGKFSHGCQVSEYLLFRVEDRHGEPNDRQLRFVYQKQPSKITFFVWRGKIWYFERISAHYFSKIIFENFFNKCCFLTPRCRNFCTLEKKIRNFPEFFHFLTRI